MALTLIEQLRLELGLNAIDDELLTEAELEHFLEKNKMNLRKSAVDAAKTLLFILSSRVHERSGTELEIWGHTWFENYMKALKLYLNDPNYSIGIEQAKAYAGGISISDIRANVENSDNLTVQVDIGIPKDGDAIDSPNTRQDVFNANAPFYSESLF